MIKIKEDFLDSDEEVKCTKIDTPMSISMVDICTSEGRLYFTNGAEVLVEIKRDEDLIDSDDYDFVVAGTEVTIKNLY